MWEVAQVNKTTRPRKTSVLIDTSIAPENFKLPPRRWANRTTPCPDIQDQTAILQHAPSLLRVHFSASLTLFPTSEDSLWTLMAALLYRVVSVVPVNLTPRLKKTRSYQADKSQRSLDNPVFHTLKYSQVLVTKRIVFDVAESAAVKAHAAELDYVEALGGPAGTGKIKDLFARREPVSSSKRCTLSLGKTCRISVVVSRESLGGRPTALGTGYGLFGRRSWPLHVAGVGREGSRGNLRRKRRKTENTTWKSAFHPNDTYRVGDCKVQFSGHAEVSTPSTTRSQTAALFKSPTRPTEGFPVQDSKFIVRQKKQDETGAGLTCAGNRVTSEAIMSLVARQGHAPAAGPVIREVPTTPRAVLVGPRSLPTTRLPGKVCFEVGLILKRSRRINNACVEHRGIRAKKTRCSDSDPGQACAARLLAEVWWRARHNMSSQVILDHARAETNAQTPVTFAALCELNLREAAGLDQSEQSVTRSMARRTTDFSSKSQSSIDSDGAHLPSSLLPMTSVSSNEPWDSQTTGVLPEIRRASRIRTKFRTSGSIPDTHTFAHCVLSRVLEVDLNRKSPVSSITHSADEVIGTYKSARLVREAISAGLRSAK
ncbi:hypothetical protein Bbelb_294480 [Branchiostoma belcheri]|nr:hypothetical protein Bbelb_294480 [Branchiostoma belcheri]